MHCRSDQFDRFSDGKSFERALSAIALVITRSKGQDTMVESAGSLSVANIAYPEGTIKNIPGKYT